MLKTSFFGTKSFSFFFFSFCFEGNVQITMSKLLEGEIEESRIAIELEARKAMKYMEAVGEEAN